MRAALLVLALLAAPGLASAQGAGDLTTYDPGVTVAPEGVGIEKSYEKKLVVPAIPFYFERGPVVDRSIFFPLFYHQKKKGDEGSVFMGVAPFWWYYRAKGARADAVFPFWWDFRKKDLRSVVVPPFFLERWSGDGSYRTGLAPLLFVQRTPGLDYTIVPPLAWQFRTDERKLVLVAPFYYHRKRSDVDMGLPPLYFNGWNDKKAYLSIFPLVWHFENYPLERSDTVVGPAWFGRREATWKFFLAPLLYFQGGEAGPGLDIIPLVHWDTMEGGSRLAVPLALGWYWRNDEKKIAGGGALLYHQYRQDDFLFRTFLPVYFGWQSDNMMRRSHLIVPVGYFDSGPIHRNMSILGLYWDFHRFDEHRTVAFLPLFAHSTDLYRTNHTTWVLPTFQYTRKDREWQFNVHPLVYLKDGEGVEKTHQVVFPLWWRFTKPGAVHQVAFPLWWDFQNLGKGTRGMSLFPLFWRFERAGGDHTLVLNSYHFKSESKDAYRYLFFPLFGFGKDAKKQETYWKVLLGLVGWRTNKDRDTLYMFWLPFKVKDRTKPPGPPQG